MTTYDTASNVRHAWHYCLSVIQHMINPHFSSCMKYYDVARNNCQPLPHPAHVHLATLNQVPDVRGLQRDAKQGALAPLGHLQGGGVGGGI
jgi:hypothetical protein